MLFRLQWFPDRYLPHCVERLIALEAGTLVLADVGEVWDMPLAPGRVLAAPQDCSVPAMHLLTKFLPKGLYIQYGAAWSILSRRLCHAWLTATDVVSVY